LPYSPLVVLVLFGVPGLPPDRFHWLALSAILKQIIADNRVGRRRKLKPS
jgi:hypothetical protein